jgi:hypothetical protein
MNKLKLYLSASIGFGSVISVLNIAHSGRILKLDFKQKFTPLEFIHNICTITGVVTFSILKGSTYAALFPISLIFTTRRIQKWYTSRDKKWLRPIYYPLDCLNEYDKYNDWKELW